MKLLIDMNLTPRWVEYLIAHGWETLHWSAIGAGSASDAEICAWAKERNYVILTNDLDFPRILAYTREGGPSIVLLRGEPLIPEACGASLVLALRRSELELRKGAIATLDWTERLRVRLLPLD